MNGTIQPPWACLAPPSPTRAVGNHDIYLDEDDSFIRYVEEAYCPKSADPVQPEVQSEQAVQLPEGLVGFKPVIHRKTAALARQMTRKPTGHFKRRCKIKSKNAKISNAKDKLISLGRDCMDFNYLLSSIPGPQFKATGTQSDVPEGKQTGPSNTEESLPILNKAKAGPVILTIKVPGQVTSGGPLQCECHHQWSLVREP